jgi:hypothetical protein
MVDEFGFKPIFSDAGVYIYKQDGDFVIALVYVDDTLFFGPNKALVNEMKAKFMKRWECRDSGDAKEFLGMRIQRNGRKILLDQRDYLNKLLERCGMSNATPASTPLPGGYIPAPNTGEVNPEL